VGRTRDRWDESVNGGRKYAPLLKEGFERKAQAAKKKTFSYREKVECSKPGEVRGKVDFGKNGNPS